MALSRPATAPGPTGALALALTPGLLLFLLATVAFLGITPITDGDLWLHLKHGEHFLRSLAFPAEDPFIFTAPGERLIIREWLAEVALYLVFRAAGPSGLVLFKAGLFALAIGLLWRVAAVARCPAPAAALILALAALVARPRLMVRPEIFSFALLACALALLLSRMRGRSPYLLLPIQILWANSHSSFFLGLLLPWPFLLDGLARRWRGLRSGEAVEPPFPLRHLAVAAVLLWPASALTPEGPPGLLYPLHLANMSTLALVDEVRGLWTLLHVCSACLREGIALLILAALALAVGAFRTAAGRGPGPGTWILVAGSAAVPFFAYRLLPYAGLILAGVTLHGLGAFRGSAQHGGEREGTAGGRPALAAGIAALLLAAGVVTIARDGRFPVALGVAQDVFPEGAARFILGADARGPIFNSFEFGGYLLWALYPRHRVFIHSDIWTSVSDDQFIARFIRSGRDPATFDSLVREYRIELLVLPNLLPSWAFVAADRRWALVNWDQVASVYARREGANAALIASHEFRFTRYAADLSYLLEVAQDPGRSMAAAAELRRAVREDPQNMAAGLSLAFLLKARGQDLEEALEALRAAEGRGLRDATLLTWKAEILAGLGRPGEAEAAVREAIRVDPRARTARLVLAGLRARAGDREGAARHLRELLARPDLSPDLRREAESRLRALTPAP